MAVGALGLVMLGAAVEQTTVREILDDAGVPEGSMGNPESRVPVEAALRLFRAAVERTGDQDFGLHLAELLERMWPPPFPVRDTAASLRQLVCDGGCVRDALDRLERYWSVLNDATEVTIETVDGNVAIRHRATSHAVMDRQVAEMTMASWLFWLRRATGGGWGPAAVWFAHARPSSTDTHARIFAGAPMRFSAACDALVLPSDVVRLPLRSERLPFAPDPAPDEILWRVPQNGFLSRARAVITAGLADGEVTAAQIASRLRMSPRTYYRRLREYGTSHHRVLDALRHECAVRWLVDPHVSAEQVAWRLGFAEHGAFHRAFRRWTGLTPTTFRRLPR